MIGPPSELVFIIIYQYLYPCDIYFNNQIVLSLYYFGNRGLEGDDVIEEFKYERIYRFLFHFLLIATPYFNGLKFSTDLNSKKSKCLPFL